MKHLKCTILAATMFALVGQAQAAFLIEPHLGYNVSASGDNTSGGVTEEYSYSGAQYGARIGGQYMGLMAGLDYTLSKPELEIKSPGETTNDKLDKSELGVFVGYNLPILLRVWGAYYFNVKAEDNDAGGGTPAGLEFAGNTKELGVGFTGLPFVSLNLIYRNAVYDEYKYQGVTTNLSSNEEIATHEFVIGVSLPITL